MKYIKVECIDNMDVEDELTMTNVYTLISRPGVGDCIINDKDCIINDKGVMGYYFSHRFNFIKPEEYEIY